MADNLFSPFHYSTAVNRNKKFTGISIDTGRIDHAGYPGSGRHYTDGGLDDYELPRQVQARTLVNTASECITNNQLAT